VKNEPSLLKSIIKTEESMKITRRTVTLGGLSTGFAAASGLSLTSPASAQSLSPTEARQIAEDAYIYGYSLITTDVTRVQMSNVPKVDAYKAPMGQFINVPKYPAADIRVISAPNADTLYSMSWLDLAEPQVFSHPDMGDRFYLFEVVDLWMSDSESSPSKRTAGGKAANYLFTPPDWKGEVPAGMKHIPMATRYMIILGRTYANGTEEDYKAVNALQAQLKVTPLSAWGKPYTPVAPAVDPNPGFHGALQIVAGTIGAESLGHDPSVHHSARDVLVCVDLLQGGFRNILQRRLHGRLELAHLEWPPGYDAELGHAGEQRRISRSRRSRAAHQLGHHVEIALSAHRGDDRGGLDRKDTDRCEQVHGDFCKGRDAAGRWLLVDHHVRNR
jgi:Protein of unknown function (DUF1254)